MSIAMSTQQKQKQKKDETAFLRILSENWHHQHILTIFKTFNWNDQNSKLTIQWNWHPVNFILIEIENKKNKNTTTKKQSILENPIK